jgi:Fic family protein
MQLPATPPDTRSLLATLFARDDPSLWTSALPDGRYLHWDELRRRPPPDGTTPEEWWATMRFTRSRQARSLAAMQRCYAVPFFMVDLPSLQRSLHEFDRANVGDKILSALGNPEARVEYQVRQLIEEAISSSEIEGARPTTRELARQMLREARKPASRDERMIVNNLRAMERMRELYESNTALTLPHLLELHRVLGEDALEVAGAAGMLRRPEHDVAVIDVEGNVWHRPPDAHGIEARVEALLRFANATDQDDEPGSFLHPIVRAIVAHFWLGYEHPFRDGNGRMARALYYWCMLRNGYEVAEFLSISGPIDRSPKAYYMAFANTETDGGDLTYFVLHQLGVMHAALGDLVEHLTRRAQRLRALSKLVASFDALNHRQRSLLEHALHHASEGQSIESHATSHRVHYMTARSDLAQLEELGLLHSRRVKKVKRYYPSETLLKSAAGSARSKRARHNG